jgi:hypothetical protein
VPGSREGEERLVLQALAALVAFLLAAGFAAAVRVDRPGGRTVAEVRFDGSVREAEARSLVAGAKVRALLVEGASGSPEAVRGSVSGQIGRAHV